MKTIDREELPDVSGSASNVVRIAAIQLAYHPALRGSLVDPFGLGDPTGSLPKSTHPLASPTPPELMAAHDTLSKRIEDAYLEQLLRKLRVVMKQCRDWGVQIAVLPEYSVPTVVLPMVADMAGDMVVVAGSSFVDLPSRKSGVYEQLGAERPALRQSVAPVIYREKIIRLVAKLSGTEIEQQLDMVPGTEWAPATLQEDLGVALGVLICLDFLSRETDVHAEHVAPKLSSCRLLAVPALTSAASLSLFQGHLIEEVSPYRRPVIFANHAPGGGTTIAVDERRFDSLRDFPSQPGVFESGEEGVLVSDVDLAVLGVGKGGRYGETPRCRPFAAASFVYGASHRELCKWLEALGSIVPNELGDADEGDVIERAVSWLGAHPPPSADGTPMQKRRWSRLLSSLSHISSLETIRRLTREVILAEDVLPLEDLEDALAAGAARTMKSWVHGGQRAAAPFATVEASLAHLARRGEVRRKGWRLAAQQEWVGVADKIHTAPVAGGPMFASPLDRATETVESEVVRAALDEGSAYAERGLYEKASASFRRARARAEEQAQANEVHGDRWRLWAARATIGEAACQINLQDPEGARTLVESIPIEVLNGTRRVRVASLWAAVGDAARARSILPEASTLPDDAKNEAVDVEQRLELLEGRVPSAEILSQSPDIQLIAGWVRSRQLDAAQMAVHALGVLTTPAELPLFRAHALNALVWAIDATVTESPSGISPIDVSDRAAVVEAIEKYASTTLHEDLPLALRDVVVRSLHTFFEDTADFDARALLPDPPVHSPESDGEAFGAAMHTATTLAQQGHVEAALAALLDDQHPWRTRLSRIRLLQQTGHKDRALEEALTLAREFPDRAPIEYATSRLLSSFRRHPAALIHAERALAMLPARGMRLRVTECLLSMQRFGDAWDTLSADETNGGAHVLYALGYAADRVRPNRSLDLWRRYVELRPDDGASRIHVATLLYAHNEPEKASQVAWTAFQEHRGTLSIQDLRAAGELQQGTPSEAERKSRLRAIVVVLHERFPQDAEAEHARLALRMSSDALEAKDAPIDFRLLEQAGYVHALSTADVISLMTAQHNRSRIVANLGRGGKLPIAAFCRALTPPISLPLLVTRIILRPRVDAPFSAPVSLRDVPIGLPARGWELLLSEVELYVLGALDLLKQFRSALSGGGRVYLFQGAWASIVTDHATLQALARSRRAEKLDEKVTRFALLPRLSLSPAEAIESEAQVALRRGGAVLDTGNAQLKSPELEERIPEDRRVSPRTVLKWLREQGSIPESVSATVDPRFASDEETAIPVPMPSPLLTSGFFLEQLLENNALDDMLAALPEVHLRERDWQFLLQRQNEAHEDQEAASLAARTHAWVAEGMRGGWLEILPDENGSGLPSLVKPKDEVAQSMVYEPLRWAASYADVLARNPTWSRVSADFFGSTTPLATEMIPHLVFQNPASEVPALLNRLRAGSDRHVSLPALVRSLLFAPEQAFERHKHLWKLAELGFTDALDASDLVALFREYGSIEGIAPRRILDRMEWMARERDHIGAEMARLRLAGVYASGVFHALCHPSEEGLREEEEPSDGRHQLDFEKLVGAEAEAFSKTLLKRAEALGSETRSDFLDLVIEYVALKTLGSPRLAWQPDDEEMRKWSRRFDGPLPGLWRFIHEWAGADGLRRAALERAVREAWLAIDGRGEATIRLMSAALHHSVRKVHGQGLLRFTSLAIETESILSAVWPVRGTELRGVTFEGVDLAEPVSVSDEQVLERGAREDAGIEVDPAGRFVVYPFPISNSGGAVRVFAAAEAILLRQVPAEASRFAGNLKNRQGVHDGSAYRLLSALERRPTRGCVRVALARRAASALWRAVRDDPTYLVRWPKVRSLATRKAQRSLHDLRVLLSEPVRLETSDEHLGRILYSRCDTGPWRRREDCGLLLLNAFEIPGGMAFGPVYSFLEHDYAAHVAEALTILGRPNDHPIARVARSILLIRAGALKEPHVELPSGETIDLRERLPEVARSALDSVVARPKPDTLAASEGALLRVCGQVVRDLAGTEPLSIREGLWLTYRLFQWLCLQLDTLSAEDRVAGIRRLAELAPPPMLTALRDRLDPFGFGNDADADLLRGAPLEGALFDHRLASVLHALGAMNELIALDAGSSAPSPRVPWQSSMIEQLLVLAARSDESKGLRSHLGWDAPDNVADLALIALFRADPSALARLPSGSWITRLRRLPADPESMDRADQLLFQMLLAGASVHPDALSEEERLLLIERVREMPRGVVADGWRMLVFPSVFASYRGLVSETEALDALIEKLTDPMAPMALTYVLLGVAQREGAERMASVLETVITTAEDRGIDPVPLAAGVGRVFLFVEEPLRNAAIALVRGLAERPGFVGDERMNELLIAFKETSG